VKKIAKKKNLSFATGECSLGAILVAVTERGVCEISLGDDQEILARNFLERFSYATFIGKNSEHKNALSQVIAFIEKPARGLDLPLDIQGTEFQQKVWKAVCKIPEGKTASYTEIAAKIGSPRAFRAVGTACSANRLAIIIPCHRIVRQDGTAAGYRWSCELKTKLLKQESRK
jgi:AraC family transcriptional regulator of adaptative response/methylated-DNA-[protein]-cysteine methyltransferase